MIDNKSILITGGTGFIGSSIANQLSRNNSKVHIIDKSDEFLWRIENNVKTYFLDMGNEIELKRTLKEIEPDIIFHLAANVDPERDLSKFNINFESNLKATHNLLLALNDSNYDMLINTGTSEEYGDNPAPFHEEMREKPVSPYSASKVASTYLCDMFSKVYDKPIITVRPFLTYGPKQISRLLIPTLIYHGINNFEMDLTPCEQTRDFIYIDDLVDAYLRLAQINFKKYEIFNIGSGQETPLKSLIKIVSHYFRESNYNIGQLDYRSGETMHFYSNIDKIKKQIDWQPSICIEDGLKKTISWWEENQGIWEKYAQICK